MVVSRQATVRLIEGFKTDAILRGMARGENIMCGGGGVAATLIALKKSGQPQVDVLRYTSLNVYDILNHECLILLSPAVEKIEEVFGS